MSPNSSISALRFVVLGLTVLFLALTVLLGAMAQVGFQPCAVCTDNTCTGSAICPDSITGLYIAGLVLGLESLLIGVILSARGLANVHQRSINASRKPGSRSVTLLVYLIAPALAIYGGALVTLGLLLPLNWFGVCLYGACVYQWVLSGYPLALVLLGCVLLAGGVAAYAIGYHRLRRTSVAVRKALSAP